ncbi:MAG: hypothetical protein ACRED1_10065 [Limisphaerales bacterium]
MSQRALAEQLGRPQTFVSKSEIGERHIDFLETLDFCAACHVSPSEFIDRLQKGKSTATEKPRKKPRVPGARMARGDDAAERLAVKKKPQRDSQFTFARTDSGAPASSDYMSRPRPSRSSEKSEGASRRVFFWRLHR